MLQALKRGKLLVLCVGLANLLDCAVGAFTWLHSNDGAQRPQSREDLPFCSPAQLADGSWEQRTAHQEPLYDCSCPLAKARYHCHEFNAVDGPVWVPRALVKGECRALPHNPLVPPGARVLFAGNSHMRQLVESGLCAHRHEVARRNVSAGVLEDISIPCRGFRLKHYLDGCPYEPSVLGVAPGQLECSDDRATFTLSNGATVSYVFMHREVNKTIDQFIGPTFGTSLRDYDIVVANAGNAPDMLLSSFADEVGPLVTQGIIKALWVPLYWGSDALDEFRDARTLNNGNLPTASQRAALDAITFFDLRILTSGVASFTVAKRAHLSRDGHFCMPSPVDDISDTLFAHVRYLWWHLALERGGSALDGWLPSGDHSAQPGTDRTGVGVQFRVALRPAHA